MSYTYIVSSQKPTAINNSIVCNFTGCNEKNLIIAKNNILEVKTFTNNVLGATISTAVYGRIVVLDFYRPSSQSQDVVFLLTEKKQFCVLGYDAATKTIINRHKGDVRDKVGSEIDSSCFGTIDPRYRAIGMLLYNGFVKVIILIVALELCYNSAADTTY